MTYKLAFHGTIKDGKPFLDNPSTFKTYAKTMEGKKITIALGLFRKPRTGKENRYYWGCVIDILANEIGYTPDEMHEALKWKFLQKKDAKIPTVQSTAGLSTVEFETYLSQIRIWASKELSIIIPDPNEIA